MSWDSTSGDTYDQLFRNVSSNSVSKISGCDDAGTTTRASHWTMCWSWLSTGDPGDFQILWSASIKSSRRRWWTYGTHSTVRATWKSRRLSANSWLTILCGKVCPLRIRTHTSHRSWHIDHVRQRPAQPWRQWSNGVLTLQWQTGLVTVVFPLYFMCICASDLDWLIQSKVNVMLRALLFCR